MAKSRSLQQAVRFALATATTAAGMSALHAQEAPSPAAAPAPVEEVVVTGSRLSTPNETSISPITSVSAVDLQQTGLTRVEDVLNNLPMVFAGMNSTTSNGADGTAVVNLRGLGPQRTLVLVDGLRLGPGSAVGGRNFSDINQIPAALIERVDVLTGGASAVYGADAVAGVVNFILNTHFEGVKVTAGYHFNQHHNDDQDGVASLVSGVGDALPSGNVNTAFGKNVSVVMGSNFADDKGNATAYITYDNQGAALQSKFDYSACSLSPTNHNTQLACSGSGTSAKNGAGGYFQAYPAAGGAALFTNTVDGKTGQFRPFQSPGDLYNFGPLNFYQTPNERWTAGTFVNYDVNSHVNVYANVMYMRNTQSAQIAPSGDFFAASFIPCANPLLTAQETPRVQHHLVDALGRARSQPPLALFRCQQFRVGDQQPVPGRDPVRAAREHPGLQLHRPDGHVQCLQERQAGAGCQQHRRQGSAAGGRGGLLYEQPGRRELQRQHLPGCLRRDGALPVRHRYGAVLTFSATAAAGSGRRSLSGPRAHAAAVGT